MFENSRQLAESVGSDAATVAAKSSPPLAVAIADQAGVPLESWVMILTGVYLLVQIGYLVWKWAREWRRG